MLGVFNSKLESMRYAVYADLSRQLTSQERSSLFESLEASVPGSGCVGLQKGPNDEVYFSLEALSETAANAQAEHYMGIILHQAALDIEYTLTLQRMNHV